MQKEEQQKRKKKIEQGEWMKQIIER